MSEPVLINVNSTCAHCTLSWYMCVVHGKTLEVHSPKLCMLDKFLQLTILYTDCTICFTDSLRDLNLHVQYNLKVLESMPMMIEPFSCSKHG